MATCYFLQKDSTSRFLEYNTNDTQFYVVLLSNDYKSKYYSTQIKLILDEQQRCKTYVYYDYQHKPFLYHFRFIYIPDNTWITKNDTIIEEKLLKKVTYKVAKKENPLDFKIQSIHLFDYDEQKRIAERTEIYCFRPEFTDTMITNFSYCNDKQIKSIIKKRRKDTTFYEKEEYFYTQSGKLIRKVWIDSNASTFEEEYTTKQDTAIYKRYITRTNGQIRQLEREEYNYKGRKYLAKYYEAGSNDFWETKTRYRKRLFKF